MNTTESPGTNTDVTSFVREDNQDLTIDQVYRLSSDPVTDCTTSALEKCTYLKVTVTGTSASSLPTYPQNIGDTGVDGTAEYIVIRAGFLQRRKLQTVSGGELFVIPYALALNSSDLPEFETCPVGLEADACGSRIDIGFSDDGCEVLAPTDLRSIAR